MNDFAISKIIKIGSVFAAWVFAQASRIDPIINQAFDQLFSLGLLMVVLAVLFREYKSSKKINAELDDDLKTLVRDQIQANNNQSQKISELTEVIKKLVDK